MLRIVHDAEAATPEIAPLDLDELCRLAARELLAIAVRGRAPLVPRGARRSARRGGSSPRGRQRLGP